MSWWMVGLAGKTRSSLLERLRWGWWSLFQAARPKDRTLVNTGYYRMWCTVDTSVPQNTWKDLSDRSELNQRRTVPVMKAAGWSSRIRTLEWDTDLVALRVPTTVRSAVPVKCPGLNPNWRVLEVIMYCLCSVCGDRMFSLSSSGSSVCPGFLWQSKGKNLGWFASCPGCVQACGLCQSRFPCDPGQHKQLEDVCIDKWILYICLSSSCLPATGM